MFRGSSRGSSSAPAREIYYVVIAVMNGVRHLFLEHVKGDPGFSRLPWRSSDSRVVEDEAMIREGMPADPRYTAFSTHVGNRPVIVVVYEFTTDATWGQLSAFHDRVSAAFLLRSWHWMPLATVNDNLWTEGLSVATQTVLQHGVRDEHVMLVEPRNAKRRRV